MQQAYQGNDHVSPPSNVVRRNRIYFVLGGILCLGIGGTFAWSTHSALVVRSQNGSVFADYVVKKQIGNAVVTDDASGFNTDICTLTLNKRIPWGDLQNRAAALMEQYHRLDGGTLLTIQYNEKHKSIIEATAVFDESTNILSLTLHNGSVQKSMSLSENWTSTDAVGS